MRKLTEEEKVKIIQKVKENSTSIYEYIASQLYNYDKVNNSSTMLVYYDYINNVCYTHVAVTDIDEDLYCAIKENKVVLVYVVKGIYDLCNYNYESIYKDSDDAADINLKDCVSNIRLNIRVNIGIYKFDYGYHYADYGVALNMLEVS